MNVMKDWMTILFPYAYNILGVVADAKDAVQEVLYKRLSGRSEVVENEKAYLIKAVINQSINLREKNSRMRYGDEWLPEPVATEEADKGVGLNDIAAYSLLILLEKLNPKERAVFILKEGFDYSHDEIAEVLSATAENSRQLLSRAKRKLEADKQLVPLEKSQQLLLDRFLEAVRDKDIPSLEQLLTQDIAYAADGGGVIKVVATYRSGIREVIELLFLVYDRFLTDATFLPTTINHQPALLYYRKGKLFLCQVYGFAADGKIAQINNVLDPEKLKGIGVGL